MPARSPRPLGPIELLLGKAVDDGLLTVDAAHRLEVLVRGEVGGMRHYIQKWSWDMREQGLPHPGRKKKP